MARQRNMFERLFGINQEEKQISSNMMGYFGVGTDSGKEYKYADLAKEGYL